jgi:hypothetical protein
LSLISLAVVGLIEAASNDRVGGTPGSPRTL